MTQSHVMLGMQEGVRTCRHIKSLAQKDCAILLSRSRLGMLQVSCRCLTTDVKLSQQISIHTVAIPMLVFDAEF